jgi:hypothetical protein
MHYLVFLPTLVHLVMDSLRILVRKKFVNHLRSGWVTAGVGILCALVLYFTGTSPIWVSVVSMLCIHFGLFSLLLNIVRIIAGSLPRKVASLWYLNDPKDGEQNWWDEKLSQIPMPAWARLGMWAWFAATGIVLEFQLYLVAYEYYLHWHRTH